MSKEDLGTSSAPTGVEAPAGDQRLSPASFTPGPWRVEYEPSCHVRSDAGCVLGFDYTTDANARLIAAAPDLLAALKPLAFCDDRQPPYGVETDDWVAAVRAARAAIARAEGR